MNEPKEPRIEVVTVDEGVRTMAVLPLRNTVVFPHMPNQLTAGRERSLRALERAAEEGAPIGIFTQRRAEVEEPGMEDIFPVGTIAKIHRIWRLPDGSIRFIIQGLERGRLESLLTTDPYLTGKVRQLDEAGDESSTEVQGLMRSVNSQFQSVVDLSPQLPEELKVVAVNIEHPGRLADMVAFYLDLQLPEKQAVLSEVDIAKRLSTVAQLLAREEEILKVGASIQHQVQEKMGKTQREYYLREQLRQIQKELSGTDPSGAELDELRARAEEAGLSQEAQQAVERELARLEQMMPSSPEYSVARTYVEWLLDLPWAHATEDHLDLKKASRILAQDHFGLEKVKERILEYLAVRRLKDDTKGPILCFVGPPGVGKTSLGRSIARAMGRRFTRISLGGVHDEAEIRGHRRTYVGALPGRIIQGLKKAGARNPVFMLDEIDKVGADFRGDPAAALLEVLDPEQNATFEDHYLDLAFDLSQVMFITTANVLHTVPPALRDRMEELAIAGYTPQEKVQIARRHLLPRQQADHGLAPSKLKISDKVMSRLIEEYTREAGVRNLDRELGALCRKSARQFVEGRKGGITITPQRLTEFLGPSRVFSEVAERRDEVGVATGLAATAAGGEILFIEATRMRGKKNLILTGQLGEVMKESAQTALSYLKARAAELGIDADEVDESDIHLHVPAGATPKEGPSAGVALALALMSMFTGRKVRRDVAITGEITLRGRVLPVGGIRDKVLAAQRAGLLTVLLPRRNENDLEDVPAEIRDTMALELIDDFDDALELALADRRRHAAAAGRATPGKAKTKTRRKAKAKPKTRTKAKSSGKATGRRPSVRRRRGRGGRA